MKVRSDAILKNQKPSRQAQIWSWAMGDREKDRAPLSPLQVVAKIKTSFNLKVSRQALSVFLSWYPSSLVIHAAKNFQFDVQEYLEKNPDINLDSEQVSKLGQIIFEKEAIGRQDPKLFVELRRLRQKDADQKFQQDKFEIESCETFLRWFLDKRAASIAEALIPKAEKIAALRRMFFADVDALEKSGAVELPE